MKTTLNLSDKADVSAWLDALTTAIDEARDTGREAIRSRRRRTLSRAELRRQLDETSQKLGDLLDAARRGLGPMLSQAPRLPEASGEPPPSSPLP